MGARRESEAQRLRRCRLMFERGYAGLPAGEARKRLQLDDIEARRQQLAAISSCGRRPVETDSGPASDDHSEPYYRRGQYA
jgi:hypothetical protein